MESKSYNIKIKYNIEIDSGSGEFLKIEKRRQENE